MTKLNGIPMIPFGLLSGFCSGQEIRITELSEEGFSFRVPEKIEQNAELVICFFDFVKDGYHKVRLSEEERRMEMAEKMPFFNIYTVWTNKKEYREQIKRLILDYDRYISLKLTGDDAYLSEKMVNYPAELDEKFIDNFTEQKKEWFCLDGKVQVQQKGSMEALPKFELAITIDRPKLYEAFLEKDWKVFCKDYWKDNFLQNHPFSRKPITRIYLGNQFCHNLFPEKEQLFGMLEKAAAEKIAVTLAFPYIRDSLLEETDALLQELNLWCENKQGKTNSELEIIVNDWAMPALLKEKPYLKPVLGVLLNKRRKDTRLSYKQGYENRVDSLAENNLNCGFYQDYLKNRYNIERFEFESCGYPVTIPKGWHSLHLPFFQTNTSQYCTLYAACKYGDRGRQRLPENCPHFCDRKVFLYPKHLNMVGRYNSLFGYDDGILWDEKQIKNYLKQGIDRVVMNLSL